MREELLKKITPIIETFIDDTLKSFSNLENIRKQAIQKERDYSDLVEEKQKEVDDYKKEKTSNKVIHDDKISALEREKQNFMLKAKNYEELAEDVRKDKIDITAMLDKAKLELIIAKDKSALVEREREDAENSKNSYELKAKGLYGQDKRLEKKEEDQKETEKKLNIREADLDIKQVKLGEDQRKLRDNDLKLRVKEKLVNGLVKRYNLEKSLKET